MTEPVAHIQRLMDIINDRRDKGFHHPPPMPHHPQQAAQWWIDFCECRMKYEIETEKLDPYQERLADSLVHFYKLSSKDQQYIANLKEKGIYYRGDSIEFMKVREKVTPEAVQKCKGNINRFLKSVVYKKS